MKKKAFIDNPTILYKNVPINLKNELKLYICWQNIIINNLEKNFCTIKLSINFKKYNKKDMFLYKNVWLSISFF